MGTMPESTYLITGATGYLGRRLVREAETRGRVYAASRHPATEAPVGIHVELDVSDRSKVLRVLTELRPTVIIHAAAVNPGQGDDTTMWEVNAEGSGHVAEGAREVGSRLVAISTDVVHDGKHGPYHDDDDANPINHYGRSKAAGETAILAHAPDTAVVRTSLMYGLDEMDRGTASFAERIKRREPQALFSDVLRNPIRVDTLAAAILRLVETTYCRHPQHRRSTGPFARSTAAECWRTGESRPTASSTPLVPPTSPIRYRSICVSLLTASEHLLGMDFAGVDTVLSMAPERDPSDNGH